MTSSLPWFEPRRDSINFLTFFLVTLLAFPASLQVPALGSAGAPATLVTILAFFWWTWYQLHRDTPIGSGAQSLRWSVLIWMFVMLAVYAHAMTQPVVVEEISPADRGMLRVLGAGGIMLVACDGILSLSTARALVRRIVIGAGLVGLLGVLQYALRDPIVDRISIPGLTASTALLDSRAGLARPSGTSTHPIEFGAILTLLLPLVVTFALKAPGRRWLYWLAMVTVCFSIFLSISRSAMICAAVGMLVLARSWSWSTRLWALLFGLILFSLVYVTTPGVLGTIGRLFTGIGGDDSVASRTGSYPVAWQFVERRPWLGRGFGTLLPEYWILDNQYLLLFVETGAVGLAAILAVVLTARYAAHQARRLLPAGFDRDISVALVASVWAGAAGLAFFDSFAYPQSTGILFLLFGISGAYWRLARAAALDPPADSVASGGQVGSRPS